MAAYPEEDSRRGHNGEVENGENHRREDQADPLGDPVDGIPCPLSIAWCSACCCEVEATGECYPWGMEWIRSPGEEPDQEGERNRTGRRVQPPMTQAVVQSSGHAAGEEETGQTSGD